MDSITIEAEQLEDWKSSDTTKAFKKRLNELYQEILNRIVDKERGEARDGYIDMGRGVKLAQKELDIFMEGDT